MVVVACAILFAVSDGLVAAALRGLAPGYYYPALFPSANRNGYAADVGAGTDVGQPFDQKSGTAPRGTRPGFEA